MYGRLIPDGKFRPASMIVRFGGQSILN